MFRTFSLVLLFSSVFMSGGWSFAFPPVADIIFTGNLSGVPEKNVLASFCSRNPYSIWVIGGNTFASPEKSSADPVARKRDFVEANKDFIRRFSYSIPILATLGEKDFEAGLHQAVSSLRSIRHYSVFILDFLGARNNENPYLLRYIDILVNGKTLRFVGLGAWEGISPLKKDILYRKPGPDVMKEIGEYLKERKKADFTILITCQKFRYDKILSSDPHCKQIFDLILSNDPAAPVFTAEKNCVPVAGSSKKGEEVRKIFFNPVPGGISGPDIQVWCEKKEDLFKSKKSVVKNIKKAKKQEKKKK